MGAREDEHNKRELERAQSKLAQAQQDVRTYGKRVQDLRVALSPIQPGAVIDVTRRGETFSALVKTVRFPYGPNDPRLGVVRRKRDGTWGEREIGVYKWDLA